ncbi:MAG: flagellar type III secretion system pore protein FliP [Hyphomonas sp.]|jgi:flagellar biosynthesis protein FliP|nr:flagellar type III secretion system pore protein FliP [Hyphomonas sp.]
MPSIRSANWDGLLVRSFLMIAGCVLFASGVAAAQVVPGTDGAVLEGILGGEGEGLSGTVVQLFLFVTVLSLVPGIAMMVTCLPFMVIVFSILRQALGVQQAPPNMMIMALAMFLTFFIMEPVFMEAWTNGLSPYIDGTITEQDAWLQTTGPFREFMMRRTDPEALFMLSDALNRPMGPDEEPSFALLSTAFMLSEIKHAFQIGFVIFMPFMVIDLVVASVLMAVGMMMVPPTVVSLPFKLGFFVLADGWLKITEALIRGYA